MDTGKVVGVVVGAVIAFVVASTLITTMITGTVLASAGGKLISSIVPIVCAAGAVIVILRTFLK